MAKKMVSIKLEQDAAELLKLVADTEKRSQGAQVEYLVIKEADRLGIKLHQTTFKKKL